MKFVPRFYQVVEDAMCRLRRKVGHVMQEFAQKKDEFFLFTSLRETFEKNAEKESRVFAET